MSTVGGIESAADALPAEQQQELLQFLAARLRARAGDLPPPRKFGSAQVQSWIAEGEAEMKRFRDRK